MFIFNLKHFYCTLKAHACHVGLLISFLKCTHALYFPLIMHFCADLQYSFVKYVLSFPACAGREGKHLLLMSLLWWVLLSGRLWGDFHLTALTAEPGLMGLAVQQVEDKHWVPIFDPPQQFYLRFLAQSFPTYCLIVRTKSRETIFLNQKTQNIMFFSLRFVGLQMLNFRLVQQWL